VLSFATASCSNLARMHRTRVVALSHKVTKKYLHKGELDCNWNRQLKQKQSAVIELRLEEGSIPFAMVHWNQDKSYPHHWYGMRFTHVYCCILLVARLHSVDLFLCYTLHLRCSYWWCSWQRRWVHHQFHHWDDVWFLLAQLIAQMYVWLSLHNVVSCSLHSNHSCDCHHRDRLHAQ